MSKVYLVDVLDTKTDTINDVGGNSMNKVITLGIIILITTLLAGYLISSNLKQNTNNIGVQNGVSGKSDNSTPTTQPVDEQAAFAIFTNGTFRIFTAAMYHNLSEDVFIQADNPNIIHVKKEGVTWNDFFSTLPFKLTSDCLTTGTKQTFCTGNSGSLKFYLNGEKNESVLNQEIHSGDKLLVTFGNESEGVIKQQIAKIPLP